MFIDIACNITQEKSLENLIEECKSNGVFPIFVGLDIESSKKCIKLSEIHNVCCFIGVHPNHIAYINDTVENIKINIKNLDYNNKRVVGIGECGLDYFRSINYEDQKAIFRSQISLQDIYDLPIFYHCRNSFKDFIEIAKGYKGVIHSFDGNLEEMKIAIENGFYIGINGCSLKTEENIRVVKEIPLDKILLETDSPYCQVRKSHISSNYTTVDRSKFNTPIGIKRIAEVISKIKGITIEEIEKVTYENTIRLFPKIRQFLQ